MTAIHSVRDLGAALRVARKTLQLTQSDLTLAAGVELPFLVELEAGKPTVQLKRVLRVIDALGASLGPRPRDWCNPLRTSDVPRFAGPGLMRVGGCGHAAVPC